MNDPQPSYIFELLFQYKTYRPLESSGRGVLLAPKVINKKPLVTLLLTCGDLPFRGVLQLLFTHLIFQPRGFHMVYRDHSHVRAYS